MAEEYKKNKLKAKEQLAILNQKMYDIAVEVNEMRACYNKFPKIDDINKIDIEADEVCLEWEQYTGCGDYDNMDFAYPASYLDDPDWRAVETDSLRKKVKLEEEERKAKKIQMEKEQKERDLKEIERMENRIKELKEKYDNSL